MDFEFDKEIDAFLRQARKGETVFTTNPQSAHLDADEISAFVENALPEKAKEIYTAHLADCDSCRKSLSELILLNPEIENETILPTEKLVVSPIIPWYRKLFALPNLAYTFGVLIVLFGGIIGFTILQNMNNSQNLEVSQISDKPQMSQQIPSESVGAIPESNAFANANISANSSNGTTYSSNSMLNSNMSVAASPQITSAPAPTKNEIPRENNLAEANIKGENFTVDGANNEQNNDAPMPKNLAEDGSAVRKKSIDEEVSIDKNAPEPQSLVNNRQVSELPVNGRQTNDLKLNRAAKSESEKTKNDDAIEISTTNVGGKTFNRKDNVWYDANYKQQSTINITRGTEKYKKLDKGLRAVVENLGGTVVIIWKDKAYRIR